MPLPKLTKLELQVMEALWQHGACSVREIQDTFPEAGRPAYTTVQTTVYRLERKKALRCVKRISNANMFEAAISREEAHHRLIDDLLELLGAGGTQIVMSYLTADFADYADRQNETTKRKATGSRLQATGTTKRSRTAKGQAIGSRLEAIGTERQNEPKRMRAGG